ncbi:MAG: hypothetical protein U1E38_03420 [Rhodospirillales bacterium]
MPRAESKAAAPGARRWILLAPGAFALLLASAAPGGADPVRVQVTPQDDRTQIALIWPSPVGMRTEVRDGRLLLRFDRPAEADFAALAGLPEFTGTPATADGGRTLDLPLQQQVTALAYGEGSAITIDLLRHGAAVGAATAADGGRNTAPAAAAEAQAQAVPAAAVRSGQHRGYSRLIFDWKQQVGYRIEPAADGVVVVFDRPAEIDARQLQRPYLRYLTGGSRERSAAETRVALRIAPGATVRDKRDGRSVVIDILAPVAGAVAVASPAAPAPQTPAPPPAAVAVPAPPAVPPPPLAADTAAQGTPEEARKTVIRLDWQQPAAAAVFRRGGALWAVFDRPSQRDTAPLEQAAAAAVRRIEQLAHERATVLRIETRDALRPHLERNGLAWIIRFAADPPPAGQPIRPVADAGGEEGPRLLLPVAEPGQPLALDDAATGETMVVVPVTPLAASVERRWQYPQFQLTETVQGIVVQPKIDTLRVRSLHDGVEITSSDGLAISLAAPPASAQPLLQAQDWTAPRGNSFVTQRQALERAVVDAPAAARSPARLRLAQFLLGRGFALEAIGVLEVAAQQHPELAATPRFLLLRGAAQLVAGRIGGARDDFRQARAAGGGDEVRLWTAAAQAAQGEAVAAFELALLPAGTTVVRSYPPDLRGPLAAWLAEAAIEGGRLEDGTQFIDIGRTAAASAEARAKLSYLQGRHDETAGDSGGALAAYETAAKLDPRRGRAEGELARTLLLRRQGRIAAAEAAAALDGLRFAWRGDALEFRILRELGGLQLETGDYPAGLRTLKLAVSEHPELPGAAEATRQMAATFERLFLGDAADRLPAVTALALWDEFEELTPAGDKGREMIRRLAERLVAVDLLDRAAALLESLLPNAGAAERGALGLRLAEIRLNDGKPEAALDALRQTASPGLAPELRRTRALAQGRALLALGRPDEALAAVEQDGGIDAELLRARVFRGQGDWPRAAAALRRIIEAARGEAAPLDERRALDVLDLAVALTLAGDNAQLAQLDADYRGAMAATPLKDAFRLLAGTIPPPGADAAALAELVERAAAFRRTLDAPPAAGPEKAPKP